MELDTKKEMNRKVRVQTMRPEELHYWGQRVLPKTQNLKLDYIKETLKIPPSDQLNY